LPKSKDHNCYLKQVNQHKTQTWSLAYYCKPVYLKSAKYP
jgi:hypothetical protein